MRRKGNVTVMRNKKYVGILTALCLCLSLFAGCGKSGNTSGDGTSVRHEPISIQAGFRNISAFIDVVHEKYPEINFEVIPYSGQNFSAYVKAQLTAGDMPDIYCTSYYAPGIDNVSDKFIDLSGYAFTDNYAKARLNEVMDGGAIYMLPTYYDCFGITYNKTLFEKNGWTLPKSLKELEELAPKAKAAGCNLCVGAIQLPGYGFQYLCNILDTGFLSSIDGRKWQKAFLSGEATLSGNADMIENIKLLERWRDLGMLNGNGSETSGEDTRHIMAEGNTLFMLGSSNTFAEGETDDQFGLMPYLSEDGTKNVFILNVSRFVGINKNLAAAGNGQKLEDALHVMEVMSTVEGMTALNSSFANTSLLPLKDYVVKPDGYYADIEDELNSGATAPFIYSGWENLVVPVGEKMISFMKSEAELDDVIKSFDDNQHLLKDDRDSIYTTAAEKIDNDHCAKLVGIAFAKASGADIALISKNKWYKLDTVNDLNLEGVSGCLYPLPVTDQEIVSITPTGWKRTIKTVTLSGAAVKELLKQGYDRNGDGNTFPYEFVAPEGFVIDDSAVYKVVAEGITDKYKEEGNITDTGIVGLDAMREYLKGFKTLSQKDITWK